MQGAHDRRHSESIKEGWNGQTSRHQGDSRQSTFEAVYICTLASYYLHQPDEAGVSSPAMLNPEDFVKSLGKLFVDVLPNLIAPEHTCAVKSRIVQNGFDLEHTLS